MTIHEDLASQEFASIQAALEEVESKSIDFNPFLLILENLAKIWITEPFTQPKRVRKYKIRTAMRRPPTQARESDAPYVSQQRPLYESSRAVTPTNPTPAMLSGEWYIGMSNEFLKAISNVDRKLQGRILQAIAHISREPITPHGDTVKPLTSEMKGLWRYRVGDFRLVYIPEAKDKRVTLLSFASRGTVYE